MPTKAKSTSTQKKYRLLVRGEGDTPIELSDRTVHQALPPVISESEVTDEMRNHPALLLVELVA